MAIKNGYVVIILTYLKAAVTWTWLQPMYSISQEICTRFCCALLCCGYAIVHNEFAWSIYPYSSGLLCWHWGNRQIATVPAKQPWWIWENQSMYNHNKAQQSKNRVHISLDILYSDLTKSVQSETWSLCRNAFQKLLSRIPWFTKHLSSSYTMRAFESVDHLLVLVFDILRHQYQLPEDALSI